MNLAVCASTRAFVIVANLLVGANLGLHVPAANNQHFSIRRTILSRAPIRVESLTRSCAKRTADALDERRTSSTSHRAPTSLAITLVRQAGWGAVRGRRCPSLDRKSTRLNSSRTVTSHAVFCLTQ